MLAFYNASMSEDISNSTLNRRFASEAAIILVLSVLNDLEDGPGTDVIEERPQLPILNGIRIGFWPFALVEIPL